MFTKSKTILSLIILCISITFSNCQNKFEKHKPNYDCIAPDIFGQTQLVGYLSERKFIEALDVEVSLEDEINAGIEILKELQNRDSVLLQTDNYSSQLNILSELLKNLYKSKIPLRSKNYELYIVKSNVINAFTLGFKIFFTTALLDIVKSKEELAMILFHEIGHNECKHFYYKIKREKAAGKLVYKAMSIIYHPLNQFDELEADCFALDVMNFLNIDTKKGLLFFDKITTKSKEEEDEFYYLDKILSTHPLSNERKECLKQFIKENY